MFLFRIGVLKSHPKFTSRFDSVFEQIIALNFLTNSMRLGVYSFFDNIF